jgi:outer membrane protein OmpA-like peptidoglycan-associated protein
MKKTVKFSLPLLISSLHFWFSVFSYSNNKFDTLFRAESSSINPFELNSIFPMNEVSFADSVVTYDPGALGANTGDEPDLYYQNSLLALGPPDHHIKFDSSFVSLGKGGTLVIKFIDNLLIDGLGPDLYIFTLDSIPEEIIVWISQNGKIFRRAGTISSQNPMLDINSIAEPGIFYSYVKLRDVEDQGEENCKTLGADIDAVGCINTIIRIVIPTSQIFLDENIEFQPDASNHLSAIVDQIRLYNNAYVSIEVYTDNRGAEDYCLLLSQQWAEIIRNYFLNEQHLDKIHFSAIGWGKNKSIKSSYREKNHLENGRIEILIKAK